jgi:hypothetical protein
MKRAILMAAFVFAACDDSIPGLCNVDSDCPPIGTGPQSYCYLGVCVAPEEGDASVEDGGGHDAGPQDGGSEDAGPVCTPSAPREQSCADGSDDDCDGLIDCADPDCAGAVCRAAAGDCDEPEKCTAGACPVDAKKVDGTECTSSCNAACQAGTCVGTLGCDDKNPCTIDTCNSSTGECSHHPVADGRGCDDGNACTTGDHCGATGVCAGAVVSCDDQNSCTVDSCNVAAGCQHSAASNGTGCGSGLVCITGTCSAACWIGSAVYHLNDTQNGNPCHVCQPNNSTTGWANAPDNTGCGSGQYCSGGACSSGCLINSTSYASGAARPGYPCQVCQASKPGAWSNVAEGTSCSSGGLPCTCVGGLAWSQVQSGTAYNLYAMWGAAGNDVWAVGEAGTALHWNQGSWVSTDTPSGMILRGVWGSRASDVWAVGSSGAIFRWNGAAWSDSSIAGDSNVDYTGIWGSDAKNVWTIGTGGAIRFWNGTSISVDTSGTTQNLRWIWGSGPGNIWIVGDAGTILHRSGESWSVASPNPTTSEQLNYVWGGTFETWTVGSATPTAYRWIGSGTSGTWTKFALPVPQGAPTGTTTVFLRGGWGVGSDVWVFGGAADSNYGVLAGLIFHWDGAAWTGAWTGPLVAFRPWGTSQDIWAAGMSGVVMHATR